MDIGFFGINMGSLSDPEAITRVAQAAEVSGYESLWTGEHVVLLDPQVPPSPLPANSPFVDTIATLSYLSAVTKRIKLGSGIILLAQRNPVVLAKELAAIDILSRGRLLFGVGVGYVKKEFDVIGIPYQERGARVTEHIEAIRTLWTEDKPNFQGKFTQISDIQSHPHPLQNPHPPIIVGGMSGPACHRAVMQADGWYGFSLGLARTAEMLEKLSMSAEKVERPDTLGELEITITPPGAIDLDIVKRYADLGVSRLVILRGAPSTKEGSAVDNAVRYVEEMAETLKLG
jgi:probable F420-dependent oxidoreductase